MKSSLVKSIFTVLSDFRDKLNPSLNGVQVRPKKDFTRLIAANRHMGIYIDVAEKFKKGFIPHSDYTIIKALGDKLSLDEFIKPLPDNIKDIEKVVSEVVAETHVRRVVNVNAQYMKMISNAFCRLSARPQPEMLISTLTDKAGGSIIKITDTCFNVVNVEAYIMPIKNTTAPVELK